MAPQGSVDASQVVADGLAIDPTLENTYSFMQDLRQALKEKDVKQIKTCLKHSDKLGWQMEITRKTFKRCLPDLLNAAKYSQSSRLNAQPMTIAILII